MVEKKYSRNIQIIHWLTAMLVLTTVAFGMGMSNELIERTLGKYQIHALIGVSLLLLTLIRLTLKLRNPQPETPTGLPNWNNWLRRIVHVGLYIILMIMGLSGIGMMLQLDSISVLWGQSSFGPYPPWGKVAAYIPHTIISKVLVAFILLHIGGVLRHQFTKGDVLARMGWKNFPSKK